MPNNYIALDRTFTHLHQYKAPDRIDENHFDWESVWESPGTNSIGWPELLEQDKILILAKAGTGKTKELKEIAKQLHEQGFSLSF